MDHWKGLSTVFNCWKFCFTIITQWWAIVDFVTLNGPIFHKIFKICDHKSEKLCDVCGQKLVWVVSTIGTTNTPSFVKIQEVTKNTLLIWHGMTPMQLSKRSKYLSRYYLCSAGPIHCINKRFLCSLKAGITSIKLVAFLNPIMESDQQKSVIMKPWWFVWVLANTNVVLNRIHQNDG